jgi:cobalt transporter subunit CbtA
VNRFRKLIYAVLASGTIAGLLLFAVQHFTIFPLIEKAESYESAAEASTDHHHEGFAAVLFGTAALGSMSLNWRTGILFGLAAFVCVDLAPSLGLPPQPPGAAVANLYARQEWWVWTVVSTAVAVRLLLDGKRSVLVRLFGIVVMILPHAIGAPRAERSSLVPLGIIHQFALISILTTGLFWITLGAVGGLFYGRCGYIDEQRRA